MVAVTSFLSEGMSAFFHIWTTQGASLILAGWTVLSVSTTSWSLSPGVEVVREVRLRQFVKK